MTVWLVCHLVGVSSGWCVIVEEWVSEDLHKKHVEELVSSGVWGNIVSHLSEDPITGYYSVI